MQRRRTTTKAKVFAGLLAQEGEEAWGLRLAKAAHLATGTIYPILIGFESEGWVSSRWEEVDPSSMGRPRRRLYKLTGLGQQVARATVDELTATQPSIVLLPGLADT